MSPLYYFKSSYHIECEYLYKPVFRKAVTEVIQESLCNSLLICETRSGINSVTASVIFIYYSFKSFLQLAYNDPKEQPSITKQGFIGALAEVAKNFSHSSTRKLSRK